VVRPTTHAPVMQSDMWPVELCHRQRPGSTFDVISAIFGRPLGQAYAIGNPSVCNVGGLWPNGLSDRDDFWHTPCPGQQ